MGGLIGIPRLISPSLAEMGWSEVRTPVPPLCIPVRRLGPAPATEPRSSVAQQTGPASLSRLGLLWGQQEGTAHAACNNTPLGLCLPGPPMRVDCLQLLGYAVMKAEPWRAGGFPKEQA